MQKESPYVEIILGSVLLSILCAVAYMKFGDIKARKYYIENGRWPDDYPLSERHEFIYGNTRFAEGQGLGDPKPEPTRETTKEPVVSSNNNFSDISNETKYFYDKNTKLCFANIKGSMVEVPCDRLGIH